MSEWIDEWVNGFVQKRETLNGFIPLITYISFIRSFVHSSIRSFVHSFILIFLETPLSITHGPYFLEKRHGVRSLKNRTSK